MTAPAHRWRSGLPARRPNGRSCSIPSSRVGEAYMNGTLVIEQGSIADFLELAMSQDVSAQAAQSLGACALVGCATSGGASLQFNPRSGRATTSRITTISTSGSTRSSSTPTGSTAAPISSTPEPVARRRPARQEAPYRGEAPGRPPGAAGARHRLRLGRPWRSISPRCAARESPASRSREEQFALARSAPTRRD